MKLDSAMHSAVMGIQKGYADMRGNAAKVASAETSKNTSPADMAKPMVELQANRQQIEAATKALKAADETVGSLIDILA